MSLIIIGQLSVKKREGGAPEKVNYLCPCKNVENIERYFTVLKNVICGIIVVQGRAVNCNHVCLTCSD